MPFIKNDFIDKVLARVDIVDVINARVKLKKQGSSYTCCCPFHQEKTPSFSVNQKKQYFNCFGCHKAGSAIKFVMEYDNLSFSEAVVELANMVGLEVEYEEKGRSRFNNVNKEESKTSIYFTLLTDAAKLFHQELQKSEIAQQYLAARGITKETIEKYEIGFAPNSWDFILKNLGQNNKERENDLFVLGLLNERDNTQQNQYVQQQGSKYYDTFRNRIIIPIRDRRGRTIAFGGRVLDNSKPKYINSKESPIYKKGYELFNLDFVRNLRGNNKDFVMITEGYMDVIALDQFGVHNAVASLGTATTNIQLDLLFKQSDKIIFCYDGDNAGRHAAQRALENTLPTLQDNKEVCFCFLPPEHDPDSLVRAEGAEGMYKFLNSAESLVDYCCNSTLVKYNIVNDGGKINFINEVGGMAATLYNAPITKQALANKVANIVGWKVEQIENTWRQIALSLDKNHNNSYGGYSNQLNTMANEGYVSQSHKDFVLNPTRKFVAHILQYPYLINNIPSIDTFKTIIKEFADKKKQVILDILENTKGNESAAVLVEKFRGTIYFDFMERLASVDLLKDDKSNDIKVADLINTINEILKEIIRSKIECFTNELYSNKNLTPEQSKELLTEISILERKVRGLSTNPHK